MKKIENPKATDIKYWLIKNNIDFDEVSSGQELLITCPSCGKDKLYLNVDDTAVDKKGYKRGRWGCKSCSERSSYFSKFKKLFGEEKEGTVEVKENKEEKPDPLKLGEIVENYQENLESNKEMKDYYFKERKFTKEAVKYFKLGADNNGFPTFPRIEQGEVTGIKTLNLNFTEEMEEYKGKTAGMSASQIRELGINKPSKWWGTGLETIINDSILEGDIKKLIIFEGRWDCVAAKSLGFKNFIGVPSAGYKQDNWVDKIEDVKKIYIMFDMDSAGQEASFSMAERLGLNRCVRVELPYNDLNDCLKKGMDKADIKELLKEAKTFDLDEVKTASDFSESCWNRISGFQETGMLGYSSGFSGLDGLTLGFQPGGLTLVGGRGGAGKTTFLKSMALFVAKEDNLPTYYLSFETSNEKLIIDLVSMTTNKSSYKMSKKEFDRNVEKLSNMAPLYWYPSRSVPDFDKLEALIRKSYSRYGIRFLFIDNINKLIELGGNKYKNEAQNISYIINKLFELAGELQLHVVAIHPLNKTDDDKTHLPIGIQNFKGSSELEFVPDNILGLTRDKRLTSPKELQKVLNIQVLKTRDMGTLGVVQLKLDLETMDYVDMEDNKV